MRELPVAQTMQRGVLQIEGLRVGADGGTLLDVPRLRLGGPGPTVILGPNGSGKSLLLRCLHGLIRPDRGSIRQDGVPLNAAIRQRQAMVFQRPVLLRRTVAANLDYVLRRRGLKRSDRRVRIEALLAEGGLARKARQSARSLSGGEAQRLAILRALAVEPEVLFLDEPTSALDPAATQAIEALVKRASRRGMRVVMVSHDIGQARRMAREVVLMRAGRVVEHALAAEFFETPQSHAARQFLAGSLVI